MRNELLLGVSLLAWPGVALAQPVPSGAPYGPGAAPTTTASIGALALANRIDVADQFPAVCGATTDATTPFISMLTAAEAGNTPLVVNCPIYFASPQTITVPSTVNLAFEGAGNITWNFGTVTAIVVPTKGRAFITLPTASITGNATLGAITMALYQGTIAGAGSGSGSGYLAGDVVSLSGGAGTQATYTLAPGNLSGGAIISLPTDPTTRGVYTALPSGTIPLTGGSGTGATMTATWWLTGIGVTFGGTYANGAIPVITISGGSPSVNAIVYPVGHKPSISAKITAGPQQSIFGGYAWVTGQPNDGDCYANWFGATPGSGQPSASATDSTAAIQAAIESCQVDHFAAGWYNVAGIIYGEPFTKLLGPSGFPTSNGGAGLPSATSAAGAMLWGTGSGAAIVMTRPEQFVQDFDAYDMAFSAASTASYSWVVYLNSPFNINWRYDIVHNNQATGGGLNWSAEIPNGAVLDNQLYGYNWSNTLDHVYVTAPGTTAQMFVGDSNFTNNYFSGGTGVIEQGSDNRWTSNMIDDATGDCLLVQPAWYSHATDTISGLVFQYCTSTALHFSNGSHAAGTSLNLIASGVHVTAGNSSIADIYFDNVSGIKIEAELGSSNSATNVASNGTVDYISADISGAAGTVSVTGSHSLSINGHNDTISGGSTLALGTGTGTALVLNSVTGTVAQSGLALTPGQAGVGPYIFNAQAVGLEFQTSGTNNLKLGLGGPNVSYYPLELPSTTVGSLAICTSVLLTEMEIVSDAVAPSYNGSLSGGGSYTVLALCGKQNGSYEWTAH
jgi:hypothetical protein